MPSDPVRHSWRLRPAPWAPAGAVRASPQLMALLCNVDADVAEVVRCLNSEPGLAARVLKVPTRRSIASRARSGRSIARCRYWASRPCVASPRPAAWIGCRCRLSVVRSTPPASSPSPSAPHQQPLLQHQHYQQPPPLLATSALARLLPEDRSAAGPSYVEYLCWLHRQIQKRLM